MLDRLVRYSLQNRLSAFILAALIACFGYYAYSNLTVEAFPDPTDTQVQVITSFEGQPTEEVERRVSMPIERALNGTPGLFRLRSISIFGLSFVTLTFGDNIEPMRARQQVTERLASATLPQGVQPELGPMATPIGEVYRYTLEGKGTDPMTLRTLQDWTVRPRLRQVSGVADVVSYGGLVKEIHVEPNPTKMATLGVGLADVFTALQKASANATGGYVERGSEMFVIRSLGIFKDISDIEKVRVAYKDGIPVLVRDVATVREGYSPRQGVVTRDQDEDAVEGIVLMRRGENPSVVLRELRDHIADLNGRILPQGVSIVPFYDRTDLVKTTLKTVFKNLAEGAALVTLVLFAFMLSVRASLIVAVVIPLSLGTSFIYLYARGMSANLLSMGAVDFGIIVDGAVILVEHLFHRLSPHVDGGESHGSVSTTADSAGPASASGAGPVSASGAGPVSASGSGSSSLTPRPGRVSIGPRAGGPSIAGRIAGVASEVARPTLFSLLIIIAAYLPIFSLERVEGRIFAPLANTVVSALVGALVVSFTLVPVLCLYALWNPKPQKRSPILVWAERAFEPALGFSMKNPLLVLILAFGALLSTLTLIPRIGTEFLPELNEGALYVTFTLPGNISLTEGRKLTPRVKELIARTPEAASLLTQLGRPEDGTDPTLPSNLEVFVKLKPLDQWRPKMHALDDVIAEMAQNLSEVPGLEYNFSQPIRDNVAENISGQFGQIAVKIYGDDLETLQRLALGCKETVATVPGAADLGIVKSGEMPQVAVKVDRAALARYDLDLGDLQDYIETAMGGHVASELWEGEKRFDVTVRLPASTREDVGAIRSVMLPSKEGFLLPLSAVADVTMGVGRAAITRENGRRYVGVRMNVRNRDLGSFVAEARSKVQSAVPLPPGYELTWGGEFENQERAMARLRLVIPLALVITFILLFSAFGTMFDAMLILLNVPFALIGGVVGLAVAHMTLSVSAAVGFIALLGQAVLNGVLVVAAIRARLDRGEPLLLATAGGTRDRLRAVLMTALLASLGLVPAAFSHAIGSETQRPIAVVVVGGTISAALLTLIVLPVTYTLACRAREALGRRQATTA